MDLEGGMGSSVLLETRCSFLPALPWLPLFSDFTSSFPRSGSARLPPALHSAVCTCLLVLSVSMSVCADKLSKWTNISTDRSILHRLQLKVRTNMTKNASRAKPCFVSFENFDLFPNLANIDAF